MRLENQPNARPKGMPSGYDSFSMTSTFLIVSGEPRFGKGRCSQSGAFAFVPSTFPGSSNLSGSSIKPCYKYRRRLSAASTLYQVQQFRRCTGMGTVAHFKSAMILAYLLDYCGIKRYVFGGQVLQSQCGIFWTTGSLWANFVFVDASMEARSIYKFQESIRKQGQVLAT